MKKTLVIFFLLSLMTFVFCTLSALAASEVLSRSIVIQSTEGSDIRLTKGTDKVFAAKDGSRLASGYTLTTGKNSYVWLKMDDNSVVKMDQSTKLDISKASSNELKLTVIRGSIAMNAAKQAEGDKTSVKAGNSTMGLRGTLFTVTYKDGVMQVVLMEGKLEGTTPDGGYALDAGNVLQVSGQPTSAHNASEVLSLKLEELNSFALETVLENADMLVEIGVITPEEAGQLDTLISAAKEAEEQANNTDETTQDEQEDKVYLPDENEQPVNDQSGGGQGGSGGSPQYDLGVTIPSFTVVFKDFDGAVLKTQTVSSGSAAVPPANPVRTGHTFAGWDAAYSNITSSLTITAMYTPNRYTVTFKDYDGTVLKTETVAHGSAATAPTEPVRTGYTFTGWSEPYSGVSSDLTVTAGYAENDINSAFTDAKFLAEIKLIVNKQDILRSDISNITNLNISNKEITSLSGIELFTALQVLDCNGNPLTSLDLSSNTELRELNCAAAHLTALDVSRNTKLTYLNCAGNFLTSLDVSNNVNLEELYCTYNDMTSAADVTGGQVVPGFYFDPQRTPVQTAITSAFTDANFLAAVRSLVGKPTGDIYASDVSQITQVYFSNMNISSLAGIEYFTALQVLYCNNNQLTSLDVSSNTALTDLYCHNNQLTALDMINNTALQVLYCYNNQLTALDLINNTALQVLQCHYNQLTALDVSSNTALYHLYCNNNQLTGLDVTNNNALAALDCSYNNMTSADDVTGWQAIGLTLGTNFCFNPQNTPAPTAITSAFTDPLFLAAVRTHVGKPTGDIYASDVSVIATLSVGEKGISSLNGIEYFTGLTTLYCYSNQLTKLDLTSNTALAAIYCYDNQLTTLDVTNNTQLTTLICYQNQLTTLDVSNNTALQVIWCEYNQLTTLDVSRNTALVGLDCYYNNMTSTDDVTGWQAIGLILNETFKFTPQNTPVQTAITSAFTDANFLAAVRTLAGKPTGDIYASDVSGIASLSVGEKGISSLNGIEYFTGLTTLYCYDNNLTALDLSSNTALEFLYCYSNQLTGLDLTSNTALTTLACYDNNLTTLDLPSNAALAGIYCYNNQLTSLNVMNNTMLTTLLCYNNQLAGLDVTSNTSLETLYCNGNQLTGLDVTNNIALSALYCYENNMTSTDDVTGWQAIGLTVGTSFIFNPQNTPVQTAITSAFTDPRFLSEVRNAVGKPTGDIYASDVSAITALDVSSNDISSLAGLEYFTGLTTLYCYNNLLTTLDVSSNTALRVLWCEYNLLTSLDVSSNTALLELDCRYNNMTSSGDVTGWQAIGLTLGTTFVFSPQNTPVQTVITAAFADPLFLAEVRNLVGKPTGDIYASDVSGITALDVSGKGISSLAGIEFFTALEVLDFSSNQLTNIDLSSNTALTSIDCFNNRLSQLDLTYNTALTEIICNNNHIMQLNIGHLTALTKIACGNNYLSDLNTGNNTALTFLSCEYNELAGLDVSSNSALTLLHCYGNYIASPSDVLGWEGIAGLNLGSSFVFSI